MSRGAIYIVSDDGPPPAPLAPALALGHLRARRQVGLTADDIRGARGLIASAALDQVDFAQRRALLEEFLAGGGRIVFNGHLLRPFAEGLQPYIPLPSQRRADLELERLAPHAVFAGIPVAVQQTQRGVAGFYGRGHNPPPPGAQALTGIGPERRPVDWEWLLPPDGRGARGGLFVHAGNDIWGTTDDPRVDALIAERLVAWSLAGHAEGKAA